MPHSAPTGDEASPLAYIRWTNGPEAAEQLARLGFVRVNDSSGVWAAAAVSEAVLRLGEDMVAAAAIGPMAVTWVAAVVEVAVEVVKCVEIEECRLVVGTSRILNRRMKRKYT